MPKKKRDHCGRIICRHGISSDHECIVCLKKKKQRLRQGVDYDSYGILFSSGIFSSNFYKTKREAMESHDWCRLLEQAHCVNLFQDARVVRVKHVRVD